MLLNLEPASLPWVFFLVLAGWRLTSLLCYEAGPFDAMLVVRRALYRAHLGSLVECFHCAGFWIAAVLVLMAYPLERRTTFLAVAVAGGVSLIEKLAGAVGPRSSASNP